MCRNDRWATRDTTVVLAVFGGRRLLLARSILVLPALTIVVLRRPRGDRA